MNADDIANQLKESQPISITPQGEIIKPEDVTQTPNGLVERSTGQPVTELKPNAARFSDLQWAVIHNEVIVESSQGDRNHVRSEKLRP